MNSDRGRKPTNFNILSEFWESKKDLYTFELSRINSDAQALTYATNQYATNFKTYMKFTVNTRQIKHILRYGVTQVVCSQTTRTKRRKISGWQFEPKTKILQKQTVLDFINEQRIILGIHDTNDIPLAKGKKTDGRYSQWIDDHMVNLVRYQQYMLSFLEHSEGRHKGYSLAPINNIRRQFVSIDINVLYYMMRDGMIIQESWDIFKGMQQDQFLSVFRIEKYNKPGKQVSSFQTDGNHRVHHQMSCKGKHHLIHANLERFCIARIMFIVNSVMYPLECRNKQR